MANSINSVFLCGNIGKEPEVRIFDNGDKVVSFTLATTTGGYQKPDGTEVPEATQWHNIKVYGNRAKVADYLHKGDRITLTGTIRYTEKEQQDGSKRRFTDIIASDIILPPRQQMQPQQQPQQTTYDTPQPYTPAPQQSAWDTGKGTADDLPF